MDLFNYKQHCRLCLKARNASKNIFNHFVEGCQEPLVQIIFSLFKIELHSHKAYPQFICRKCLTEVENILLFKEDVLRNQEFLLGLFRAAYPNYVEKKTSDSRKIYHSNSSAFNLTSLSYPGYSRLQEGIAEQFGPQASPDYISDNHHRTVNSPQTASSSENNDHYLKSHCSEETQKEDGVTRNAWKQIIKNQHLKTDENRNFPNEQTDISENNPNHNNAGYPNSSNVDININPAERDIPQASFLQNFNLITLQDAEILRTMQGPLSRNRRRFVSKKFKTLNPVPVNIPKPRDIIQKRTVKSAIALSKNATTIENSPDLLTRRSINFLSRYGSRKLNHTCLKRGEVLRKDDRVFNIYQRKKNVNTISKTIDSSKDRRLSLGPRTIVKSEAVLEKKGCDIQSNLDNSCRYTQDISASEIKLEKDDSAEYNIAMGNIIEHDNSTKKPGIVSMKRSTKILQNVPRRTRKVNKQFENNNLCVDKSEHCQSSGICKPILPNYIYQSKPKAQNKKTLKCREMLRNNIQSNSLADTSTSVRYLRSSKGDTNDRQVQQRRQNKIRNNALEQEEYCVDNLKIKLFRSPSSCGRSGSEGETEQAFWSIGDCNPPSRRKYDFRNKLQLQNESLSNRLRGRNTPSKLERSKSLGTAIGPKNALFSLNVPTVPTELKEESKRSRTSPRLESPQSSDSVSGKSKPKSPNKLCAAKSEDFNQFRFTEVTPTAKKQRYLPRNSKCLSSSGSSNDINKGLVTNSLNVSIINADPKRKKGRSRKLPSEECLGKTNRQCRLHTGQELPNKVNGSTGIIRIKTEKESHELDWERYDDKLNNELFDNVSLTTKETKQELMTDQDFSEINTSNLEIKSRTVSFENIASLKYDTQETDDVMYNDGLEEPNFIDQHIYKERSFKNKLLDKVWNINVSEDQEFQLTLTHTDFVANTMLEDMDYADLSEYPRRCEKDLDVEVKCEEIPSGSTTGDFSRRLGLRPKKGRSSNSPSNIVQNTVIRPSRVKRSSSVYDCCSENLSTKVLKGFSKKPSKQTRQKPNDIQSKRPAKSRISKNKNA